MLWYEAFDTIVREAFPEMEVRCDEPMRDHTTFRIGGGARRMAFPASLEEMTALLNLAQEHGWDVFVVGNGSNLLICDEGLDKLVIMTAKLCGITVDVESGLLVAGAGAKLSKVAVAAQENGLGGLAFAHGIPGSLGGAVFMNAGAYGGEMVQVIKEVTAWLPDRGVCVLGKEELDMSYRHSCFSSGEGVVLSAALQLTPHCDKASIRAEMDDLIARRKASQPLEMPSAGSTFKRPVGYFAGTLIDQCGLKGLTVGGAQVSEKHAGFIVNRGNATCADVVALIEKVRAYVLKEKGVELEAEVRVIR